MTRALSPEFREAVIAFQSGDLDRARAAAQAAISTAPTPQWQHLLGLVHCRLGDVAAGIDHLRAAASAEPDNASFQLMLSRALVDAGRPSEALDLPKPPPPTSPAAVALWQARGEAADAAGKIEGSVEAWAAVATAVPGDWRAWANLGNAFAAQHKWPDAAQALLEAHAINPGEQTVRQNAVAALLRAGRQHEFLQKYDEAEVEYRRAYELEPANARVVHHLGVALERTNRLDELRRLMDEARGRGVTGEEMAYLQALLARREGRLGEARELLLQADRELDPVRWHALRAKVADSLGDAAEAFDAATAMNRAAIEQEVSADTLEEWEKGRRIYRADLRELAAMITPDWARQLAKLEDPVSVRLSFLVGFPRSGTTLLDTFLLGHPQIDVLEEKQLVGRAADVVGGSMGLSDASTARLRRARKAYFDLLVEYVPGDFSGLVVDKFPLDMAAAPVIETLFPRAPIIFAQRHPCDVVLSGFMQPIGIMNFSDIEAAADYYDAMMSIWTAARAAMDLNVHTVVYEDLVRDPEPVLRPLVDFLGLEWDDGILEHRETAKRRGTIATPSYDQVTEPVSTRAVGRWKRYREQLEPVLPVLLPWAERLGYRD